MISKQYIKDLEFKTIEDFFEYVIESKINGNYSQVRKFIKEMSRQQRQDFYEYLEHSYYEDKQELMKMLI